MPGGWVQKFVSHSRLLIPTCKTPSREQIVENDGTHQRPPQGWGTYRDDLVRGTVHHLEKLQHETGGDAAGLLLRGGWADLAALPGGGAHGGHSSFLFRRESFLLVGFYHPPPWEGSKESPRSGMERNGRAGSHFVIAYEHDQWFGQTYEPAGRQMVDGKKTQCYLRARSVDFSKGSMHIMHTTGVVEYAS